MLTCQAPLNYQLSFDQMYQSNLNKPDVAMSVTPSSVVFNSNFWRTGKLELLQLSSLQEKQKGNKINQNNKNKEQPKQTKQNKNKNKNL